MSALALVGAVGCGGGTDRENIGIDTAEIINGSPDTTHDGVVACFSSNQGCSGTVVHHDGFNAFILTAAHCMYQQNTTILQPLEQCVSADDYNGSIDWAAVVGEYEIHPQYDDQSIVYDFAMLRLPNATGAAGDVIPAMSPQEDTLGVGSSVLHVGFGVTQPGGGGSNSQRRSRTNVLSEMYQLQIVHGDQSAGGPCSGDSGGPALSSTSGAERVAGVISFGDQDCTVTGVSGRVSAVYPWVTAFTGQGGSTSSSSSSSTSTGAGGSSSGTGVGGGGVGGGVGAGGSSGPPDQWFAGDEENQDPDGVLVTSCAFEARDRDDRLALTWPLLGLLLWRRRRDTEAASSAPRRG